MSKAVVAGRFDGAAWKRLISPILPVPSKYRTVMATVHMVARDGWLVFEATDSYVLAETSVQLDGAVPDGVEIDQLLDPVALKATLKGIGARVEVTIAVEGSETVVIVDGVRHVVTAAEDVSDMKFPVSVASLWRASLEAGVATEEVRFNPVRLEVLVAGAKIVVGRSEQPMVFRPAEGVSTPTFLSVETVDGVAFRGLIMPVRV